VKFRKRRLPAASGENAALHAVGDGQAPVESLKEEERRILADAPARLVALDHEADVESSPKRQGGPA
jgi:hypothetical protein